MNRYLLNIAYIGTNFRGVQKTVIKAQPRLDTTTIQGSIELALQVFRPINDIKTHLSSRTDAGVHALHSTIHVDLKRNCGLPYDEDTLTGVLNRTLDKHNLQIRVLNTTRVPETFHCRYNAKGRTYLYRFAVAKTAPPLDTSRNQNYMSFIPIEEAKRCFFVQDPRFDIEAFKEAANFFKGRHDFRTFMSTSKQVNQKGPMFSIRTITDIKIYPGKSIAVHTDAEQADALYNYWNLEISGRSFLYKQVRRIVGTLITAAYHRISLKEIYEMITIPSKNSWNPRITLAPAFGLYLSRVHYNQADLQFSETADKVTAPTFRNEFSSSTTGEEKQAQAN